MEPWEILNVSPDAKKSEIMKAFRTSVRRKHPDSNNGIEGVGFTVEEYKWAKKIMIKALENPELAYYCSEIVKASKSDKPGAKAYIEVLRGYISKLIANKNPNTVPVTMKQQKRVRSRGALLGFGPIIGNK